MRMNIVFKKTKIKVLKVSKSTKLWKFVYYVNVKNPWNHCLDQVNEITRRQKPCIKNALTIAMNMWNMHVRCLKEQALVYKNSCVSNKLRDITTICRCWWNVATYMQVWDVENENAEIALFAIQLSCYLAAEHKADVSIALKYVKMKEKFTKLHVLSMK